MDYRLEPIDKMLADADQLDAEREVSLALPAIDWADPHTLRWAAAMLALRADELDQTEEP